MLFRATLYQKENSGGAEAGACGGALRREAMIQFLVGKQPHLSSPISSPTARQHQVEMAKHLLSDDESVASEPSVRKRSRRATTATSVAPSSPPTEDDNEFQKGDELDSDDEEIAMDSDTEKKWRERRRNKSGRRVPMEDEQVGVSAHGLGVQGTSADADTRTAHRAGRRYQVCAPHQLYGARRSGLPPRGPLSLPRPFQCHADRQINFIEQINYLSGPNGSGACRAPVPARRDAF